MTRDYHAIVNVKKKQRFNIIVCDMTPSERSLALFTSRPHKQL